MARPATPVAPVADKARKFAIQASLLAYLIVVLYPMIWLLISSVRKSQELFTAANPWGLPKVWYWQNYHKAWVEGKFGAYFVNSVVITTASLLVIISVSAMAAYVLGRFKFRGSRALLYYFLAGMTFPMQLMLIPLFFQMLHLHLLNTYASLIIIYSAASLPFTIFVLSAFFEGLPGELHDAAEIDGCSEFGVFWRIMLPLARPGLITVAIFNFLGIWNEYLYALVFITDERLRTLPLGLANLAINKQYDTDLGALFAGCVIVMVPALIVYGVLQSYLTKGLASGAIKG